MQEPLWTRSPDSTSFKVFTKPELYQQQNLMTEVTMTGKYHSDAMFIRCLNYFLIANGSARLDDCLNAIFCQCVNIVTEREECI